MQIKIKWSNSTRLQDFSDNIFKELDNANSEWNTFERNRDFKKSGNKKATAVRWIYLIIVFLIFSCGILMILRRKFDYFFLDVIMVIVLSVGIIYILVLYLDMNNRSLTDFDKIRPDAITLTTQEKKETTNPKYGISGGDGDLESNVSLCAGQACCSNNTTWNSLLGRCVKPEAFACMGPSLTENYDYQKVYTKY